MAKASKKAGAKKAAAGKAKTTSVKKNKFTVDLGKLNLNDEERFKLLDAVQKTVSREQKTVGEKPQEKAAASAPMKATVAVAGATISATFRNVNPGLSELTATHNGVEKTITQSGTIDLANVKKGEIIMVQGKSLGKADISIDREADPQAMKFNPGVILFNFFILS